jgi:hypothetical protein
MIMNRASLDFSLLLCLVTAVFLTAGMTRVEAAASQLTKGKTKMVAAKKSTTLPVKTHPEPSQAEFEATRSGMFAQSGMTDISDSPIFFTVSDQKAVDPVARDLDRMIRPVLKRLFNDAKLVEELGEQPPSRDGEVVENKLVYVVRMILTEEEAKRLHAELHEKEKWPTSPRIGSAPIHFRTLKEVWMSFSKSTNLRGYSLEIKVNYENQRVTVISYRLGSKYDRLM